MKKLTINGFRFFELSETIQNKIIGEFIEQKFNVPYRFYSPKMKKAIKIANQNLTPWFAQTIYYHELGGEKTISKQLEKFWFDKYGNIINLN